MSTYLEAGCGKLYEPQAHKMTPSLNIHAVRDKMKAGVLKVDLLHKKQDGRLTIIRDGKFETTLTVEQAPEFVSVTRR